jgi:hypothetical protein
MDLARETLTDLLRSSWIIESARRDLFEGWSKGAKEWSERAGLAAQRAELLEEALAEIERKPDVHLVEAHTSWLRGVVGEAPGEVPLGDLFAARLGDWVEAHVSGFVGEKAERLKELGDQERAALVFPSDLPGSPPFEPVPTIEVDPPGEVRFRFAILGDLHFGSPMGEEMARAAIADINRSGSDLVIQMGDITDHGYKDEFAQATAALAGLEIPCTTMMGNHDVVSIGEETVGGRELYGNAFGREADGLLFEHKEVRFAVLDSATHAVSPFAPFNFVSGSFVEGPGGALVHGSLTVPQHEILADVADPGSPPAFVFLHHPPQPFAGFPPILFGLRESDSGRLHATCDSGNVWGVFAGHTHRIKRTTNFGDVPAHEVAIARDYPFGYTIIDVTERGYSVRFVQLSDEALLRKAYKSAAAIHRRYGLGSPQERSFVWSRDSSARS